MEWVWRHPTPPGLHGYIGIAAMPGAPAEGLVVWAERWTRTPVERLPQPPLLGSPTVKDVGLVGMPFSGKSTLFTAMTRAGSHGGQANVAVVPVPDPRLQVLTEMESSAKTVAGPGSIRRRAGRGVQRAGTGQAAGGRRARRRAPLLRSRLVARRRARVGPRRAAARRPRGDRERAREGGEEVARQTRTRGGRAAAAPRKRSRPRHRCATRASPSRMRRSSVASRRSR